MSEPVNLGGRNLEPINEYYSVRYTFEDPDGGMWSRICQEGLDQELHLAMVEQGFKATYIDHIHNGEQVIPWFKIMGHGPESPAEEVLLRATTGLVSWLGRVGLSDSTFSHACLMKKPLDMGYDGWEFDKDMTDEAREMEYTIKRHNGFEPPEVS